MTRKIIYYSVLNDAIACAARLRAEGYATFIDSPNRPEHFLSLLPLDSDTTEEAVTFLFDRLRICGEFEAAIVHSQLFAHYPRIYRILNSFLESGQKDVVCFIPCEKITVFDLSFSHDTACDFENLTGAVLEPARLDLLVEMYPSGTCEVAHTKAISKPSLVLARVLKQLRAYFFPHKIRPRKILFVAHDNEANLYLRPLISVFAELRRRNIPFEVVCFDDRARNFLQQEGVSYINIEALTDTGDPNSDEHAMKSWFFERIASGVSESGNSLYDEMLRYALNSAVRRDLWERHKATRGVVNHAKRAGITDVFLVPDGTPIATGIRYPMRADSIRLHTMLAAGISKLKRGLITYSADVVYCAGSDAQMILLHHYPDREIVAVGNPVIDRYLSAESLELPLNRTPILIATSGFDPNENEWMVELVQRIDPTRYLLMLKPHPSYPGRYDVMRQHYRQHLLLDWDANIEQAVNAAALVVTDHSQVGIDAHLLGKPVISMHCGSGDILYMRDIESVYYVHTVDTLLATIERTQWRLAGSEFIKAFNAGGDRYYYRRLVDYLVQPIS